MSRVRSCGQLSSTFDHTTSDQLLLPYNNKYNNWYNNNNNKWLGGVMVRILIARSRGRGFDSSRVTIKLLLLGWVTVCGQLNHLGM